MIGQWLGDGPGMVGEIGRAIDEVGSEEERDWVYEERGYRCRYEECCDDMSGSVAAVACEGFSQRMRLGEDRCFGCSKGGRGRAEVSLESPVW